MIISFLISTVLYPVSVFLIDTCQVIDLVLHDEASFKKYSQLDDDTLMTCKKFAKCDDGS
jgi:hypothetical protein